MKNLLSLLTLFILLSSSTFAQDYLSPLPVVVDGAKVNISDVAKSGDSYKFRLIIENITTDHYLAYSVNQTVLDIPKMGKIAPEGRDKLIMIAPGDKKSMVINAKATTENFFPKFELLLNGLYKGKIPSEAVSSASETIASGNSDSFGYSTANIELLKVEQKKGVFTIQSQVKLAGSLAAPKQLLCYDPSSLMFDGITQAGKPFVVYPGGKKKFKIQLSTEESSISGSIGSAFKIIDLTPLGVDPIAISDGSKVYETCDAHNANLPGDIQIKVSSDVGCFKFVLMGESYTPEFTSNLTFHMNASTKKIKVIMDNGAIIEKSIYAKADYKALYYEIREKDDKYVMRYLPGASELSDVSTTTQDNGSNNSDNSSEGGSSSEYCEPIMGNTTGTTLVKINSEVGCFDFFLMGEKLTSRRTSNFSFKASNSAKKVKVVLSNGITIEKTLMIGEGYETIYYSVIKKKDKYVIKQSFLAAELSQKAEHEVKCEDEITDNDFNNIRKVTILEITGDLIYYKSCGSDVMQSISKYDILRVSYSDGSCDKFDYDGGPKHGLNIRRSPKELVQIHLFSNSKTKQCNSFLIGPAK